MASAAFGTPLSIIPLYASRSGSFTSSPSTEASTPPIGSRFRPVAVTITSASSSSPDSSRMPVSVNVSTRSVTIEAFPSQIASNMSPSGTRHRRWSHGL